MVVTVVAGVTAISGGGGGSGGSVSVAPTSLFGNSTGATSSGESITLGTGLTFSGSTINASLTGSGVGIVQISTGAGLTGGPITSSGTIALATIAPLSMYANISSATTTPTTVTLGGGLGFSGSTLVNLSGAADGVTQISTGTGLTGGPVTSSGTLSVDSKLQAFTNLTWTANYFPFFNGVTGVNAQFITTAFRTAASIGYDKGYIVTFSSTTQASGLPPGANGTFLYADSTATGGLRYTASITVSSNNEFAGFYGSQNAVTGTTYTVSSADAGRVLRFTTVTGATVTLVSTMQTGFSILALQAASGAITFTAGAGATMNQRQSHNKIAGQYGVASLLVATNSGGSAAQWILGGDTST